MTKKEGRYGTPERPLSKLGALAYGRYWQLAVYKYLRNAPDRVTLEDIARHARMQLEDVYNTLVQHHMITVPPSSPPPSGRGTPTKRRSAIGVGIARKNLIRRATDISLGVRPEPLADGRGGVPKEYQVHWDRNIVREWLERYEAKGLAKLKPEKLRWSPYLVSRSQAAQGQKSEMAHTHPQAQGLPTLSLEDIPDAKDAAMHRILSPTDERIPRRQRKRKRLVPSSVTAEAQNGLNIELEMELLGEDGDATIRREEDHASVEWLPTDEELEEDDEEFEGSPLIHRMEVRNRSRATTRRHSSRRTRSSMSVELAEFEGDVDFDMCEEDEEYMEGEESRALQRLPPKRLRTRTSRLLEEEGYGDSDSDAPQSRRTRSRSQRSNSITRHGGEGEDSTTNKRHFGSRGRAESILPGFTTDDLTDLDTSLENAAPASHPQQQKKKKQVITSSDDESVVEETPQELPVGTPDITAPPAPRAASPSAFPTVNGKSATYTESPEPFKDNASTEEVAGLLDPNTTAHRTLTLSPKVENRNAASLQVTSTPATTRVTRSGTGPVGRSGSKRSTKPSFMRQNNGTEDVKNESMITVTAEGPPYPHENFLHDRNMDMDKTTWEPVNNYVMQIDTTNLAAYPTPASAGPYWDHAIPMHGIFPPVQSPRQTNGVQASLSPATVPHTLSILDAPEEPSHPRTEKQGEQTSTSLPPNALGTPIADLLQGVDVCSEDAEGEDEFDMDAEGEDDFEF